MAIPKHISGYRGIKWLRPLGYDTGIKVYNCTSRNKEPFIVANKNLVTWYTCGPTVYDSAHIGHASCFVKLDIIQRIMREYFHLNLVTVMNITDIDDKIIARSNATKVPIGELVENYEKEFWRDMDALGVKRPNCVLRVTENMEFVKKFIEKLVENRQAYVAEDSCVYFDVKAYEKYGKLQNIGKEGSEEVMYKKSSMDFAMWKAAKPNEVYWESPWGNGRPGWHVECSALASRVFGSKIDIHAGGVDLRFPHHENEEAQSCQFHGTSQWVNYWLHTGHLHLKNDEKMSKSLQNTISISTLLENTPAKVFRMACVMTHYRSSMEFSSEFMTTASDLLESYANFMDNCRNYMNGLIKADIDTEAVTRSVVDCASKIHDALVDDFNTPLVIKSVSEIISAVNSIMDSSRTDLGDSKKASVVAASNIVSKTIDIFGLGPEIDTDDDFVDVMNILNEFRQNVRQIGVSKKDVSLLELCDNVRNNLKRCGITIKDHGKLSSWS